MLGITNKLDSNISVDETTLVTPKTVSWAGFGTSVRNSKNTTTRQVLESMGFKNYSSQ
jgi:hypothetical protein